MKTSSFCVLSAWMLTSAFGQVVVEKVQPDPLTPGNDLTVTLSNSFKTKKTFKLVVNGKAQVAPTADLENGQKEIKFNIGKDLAAANQPWESFFSKPAKYNISVASGTGQPLKGAQPIQFEPLTPKVSAWKRMGASDDTTSCPTEKPANDWPADEEHCVYRLGDSIEVTVSDSSFKPADKIVLWLDGAPMPLAAAGRRRSPKNRTDEIFRFDLPQGVPSSTDKESWLKILRQPWEKRSSTLSVGTEAGPPLDTSAPLFYIRRLSKEGSWAWGGFVAALAVLMLYLGSKKGFLKEWTGVYGAGSDGKGKIAYSLAKTQAMVWTFVVASSYSFIWLVTWNEDTLNGKVLVLLGLAIGTTVLGAVIDESKQNQAKATIKDAGLVLPPAPAPDKTDKTLPAAPTVINNREVSEAIAVVTTPEKVNFLVDLISDQNGPAVQRVQMLVFTIILMGIFVTEVYRTLVMPEFPETLLGLMGISSSGYLAMKVPEKK